MSSASMIEARAADWIAQRDGEHWTEAGQQALDAWLAESPLHRVAFLRLDAAWQRADRLRALRPAEPVARGTPVLHDASPRARSIGIAAWGARAAALLATVGLVVALTGDPGLGGDRRAYATAIGVRETVALDDGSRLTLNTATQLSTRLDGRERTVWFQEGEAFFDVAHDPGRPFVIVAGPRRVTVIGTRFSLRRDGDRLQVDVVEGRVQVQVRDAAPTLLVRGESAVGVGENVLVTRRTERQTLAATSWLEGRLIFDQMTIAEAAAQFNRYNRKKLVVADDGAANIRIGGSFEATNVEGFARLVQSGFGLAIDVRDDRIVISSAAR